MATADSVELEATQVSGRRIGRYTLRYEIASGGMGEVYLAQMRGPAGVDRWVALKVLRPEIAEQPKFVTMFLDEARIVSRLSHPNLCAVVDFGQTDGRYFLALEYLHGETMSYVVRRLSQEVTVSGAGAPRPFDLLARVVADAARGLHAAHEASGSDGGPLNIVHRDVSPQNVFVLYDGVGKVMDFGIAVAKGRESHTHTGEVKGKFAYMSPEQLSGKSVDRRTDVFALGVVLWEACVGRRLFRAESEGETVLNVMSKPIPIPSDIAKGFPAPLERVLLKALDRDLSRRYPTAAAMADDIEEYLAVLGRPVGAAQVSMLMRRLFGDRIAMRDAMLRARMPSIGIVPEVELESGSSIRTVVPPSRTVSVMRSSWRRRFLPIAIGSTFALAVALTLAIWAKSGGGEQPRALSALPAPQPALPVLPPQSGAPAAASPAPESRAGSGHAASPSGAEQSTQSRGNEARDKRNPPAVREPSTPRPLRQQTGTLNLLTTPTYATVYLGGRRIGTTPLFEKRLPVGRHTLRLAPGDRGQEKRVTVEIRAGHLTSLSVRLGP